jgi:hypothetical protein
MHGLADFTTPLYTSLCTYNARSVPTRVAVVLEDARA